MTDLHSVPTPERVFIIHGVAGGVAEGQDGKTTQAYGLIQLLGHYEMEHKDVTGEVAVTMVYDIQKAVALINSVMLYLSLVTGVDMDTEPTLDKWRTD